MLSSPPTVFLICIISIIPPSGGIIFYITPSGHFMYPETLGQRARLLLGFYEKDQTPTLNYKK
jgi:hypothetical protein